MIELDEAAKNFATNLNLNREQKTDNLGTRSEAAFIKCAEDSFWAGANWQRNNYPKCESCKYWRDYSCQNGNVTDYVNAEDLVAFTFDVGEDFGCCLHEEKEK